MEKINKAHKDAELWDSEHKKIQQRQWIQESQNLRQAGIIQDMTKVLKKEAQFNKTKFMRGEFGTDAHEILRLIQSENKKSAG